MLVDGQWSSEWHPVQASDSRGAFVRQTSSFRHWVTPDGAPGPSGRGGFKAEPGRYHLYVALICPWACRTLIARRLKRLEDAIDITVVEPALTDQGWRFGDYPGSGRDTLNGATYIHELYTRADGAYTGRATVPVLWDKHSRTIVNNESADIVRMLNEGFGDLADASVDLYPADLRTEIEGLNTRLYAALNNGVYRAGFAGTQDAYDEAVRDVFAMLDDLEGRLDREGPYLFAARLTEADIRLFVTLVRFDLAYHGQFKCNLRRIVDYPALSGYLDRLLRVPAFRTSVNPNHIKTGYYSIKTLNPSGIIPVGPDLPWLAPPEPDEITMSLDRIDPKTS